jgi:adenylyl- and sulfurtransferase ThiI
VQKAREDESQSEISSQRTHHSTIIPTKKITFTMMISARTSLQLTRRVLSRATRSALASQSPSVFVNGSSHGSVAAQFLSTEAAKSEAAPFVPGVGKNKTSTGLVRAF